MLDKVKQEIEDILVKYGVYEWDKATNEILKIAAMLALDACHDYSLHQKLAEYLELNDFDFCLGQLDLTNEEFEKLADLVYEMNRDSFLYSSGGMTSVTIPDLSQEKVQEAKELIEKTVGLQVASVQKRSR